MHWTRVISSKPTIPVMFLRRAEFLPATGRPSRHEWTGNRTPVTDDHFATNPPPPPPSASSTDAALSAAPRPVELCRLSTRLLLTALWLAAHVSWRGKQSNSFFSIRHLRAYRLISVFTNSTDRFSRSSNVRGSTRVCECEPTKGLLEARAQAGGCSTLSEEEQEQKLTYLCPPCVCEREREIGITVASPSTPPPSPTGAGYGWVGVWCRIP